MTNPPYQTNNIPPGYIVNNKLFFSRHLAHLDQMLYGGTIQFNMFDKKFSTVNWKIEPESSFEELIDLRARQLRESFDKIVLWFSGGTDSITMYNAFKRNKLHIDEIIVRYWPLRGYFGIDITILNWLKENHYDKKTTITAIDQTKENILSDIFKTENWSLKDIGYTPYITCVPAVSRSLQKKYENKKWCQIHGFEKPHLIYRNGKFFSWHLDKVFQSTLGHPNFEYFYISPDLPELHIKQCHMLKNYFIKYYKNRLHEDFRSETQFALLNQELYLQLSCMGCGRHGEIIPTICVNEKKLLSSKKIINSPTENYKDMFFSGYQSELHNHSDLGLMNNWYKGRMNIIKSPLMTFMLNNNLITDANDPFSFVGIYSKQYEL